MGGHIAQGGMGLDVATDATRSKQPFGGGTISP